MSVKKRNGCPASPEYASISITARKIPDIDGFIYYVDTIHLGYSSAKATSNNNTFDYSIEIKPTYLSEKEKKTIELSPIVISSVQFTTPNIYPRDKHRTDIIALPENAILTEISMKIVESNPAKVRAEKILSIWNTYKDSTKNIINIILPKEKESSANQAEGNTSTESDSKKPK